MKRSLLFWLVTAVIIFSTNTMAEETTISFSIGEWAPYTVENVDGHGMATEIVTAACKAAGLVAEYEFAPWKRAENNVQAGKNFGTFPYKVIESRLETFVFSDTMFSNSFGVVTHAANTKTTGFIFSKPGDFKGFKVGIIAGTDAIKNALSAEGIEVEEVQDVKQNLSKLEVGRIDFYIDDKAVIYQAIQSNYPGDKARNFVFTDKGFGEMNDWKIMVSKEYPGGADILEKINGGLKKIKETGEYETIMKKYGM